jgi:imidazolonepropionase-like amidohydrolase
METHRFTIPDLIDNDPNHVGISLMRDSFRRAKLKGSGGQGGGGDACNAPAPALTLANVRVWCSRTRRFSETTESVTIVNGRIVHVGLQPDDASPYAAAAAVIDCAGGWLLPGLCDAHVHCTAVTADLAGLRSMPESLVTAGAAEVLGGMLLRGFTTVRDCGGADFGLAAAVDSGQVLGPKVLFTGHALSQTGGHGDMRGAGEDACACACGAALRGIGRVCDGVSECRRAARDELRRGAHAIKVMASGGVASPTDRLTNTQFSLEELRAIVEEAEAAGTYVCALRRRRDGVFCAVAQGLPHNTTTAN